MKTDSLVIIVALLVAISLIVVLGCRGKKKSEGYGSYVDVPIDAQCTMTRTPNDYSMNYPSYPQFIANRESYRAPLEYAPVDFEADLRPHIPNWVVKPETLDFPLDAKTHHDLVNNGDLYLDHQLFG